MTILITIAVDTAVDIDVAIERLELDDSDESSRMMIPPKTVYSKYGVVASLDETFL